MLTKQETLLGHQGGSRRVSKPRRTALPHGSQSQVLWCWDSLRLSLANHCDPGSFLVVHTLLSHGGF